MSDQPERPSQFRRAVNACMRVLVWAPVSTHIRRRIALGLAIALPIIFTYVVLRFVFDFLDGFLRPAIDRLTGRDIPGVGVVALVLMIYLTGLVATNLVGRGAVRGLQRGIQTVPVVRNIYAMGKQITDAFGEGSPTGFNRVVTVQYPRPGVWAIGFLTGFTEIEEGDRMALVYLPTSPLPNSGWLGVFPLADVFDTDVTVQDAMQMVVSGGLVYPTNMGKRPLQELSEAAHADA